MDEIKEGPDEFSPEAMIPDSWYQREIDHWTKVHEAFKAAMPPEVMDEIKPNK
jgi:hypothetical protein